MALSREELIKLQKGPAKTEPVIKEIKKIQPTFQKPRTSLKPYLDIIGGDIKSISRKVKMVLKVLTKRKAVDETYKDFMEQYFPEMK